MVLNSRRNGALIVSGTVAAAAVVGATAALSTKLPALIAAAVLYGIAAYAVSARPRVAVGLVLAVLMVVPMWIVPPIGGITIVPTTMAAAVALWASRPPYRLAPVDLFPATVLAVGVLATFAFDSPQSQLRTLILQGIPAYAVARFVVPRAGFEWTIKATAVGCVFLGAWAIAERLTDIHLFASLVTGPEWFWSAIQERAGASRSEAALGHSIALSVVLVAGAAMLLSVRDVNATVTVVGLILILGGVLATASRAGLIGLAVACVVTVLATERGRTAAWVRPTLAVVLILSAFPAVAYFQSSTERAGDEAAVSSSYREGFNRAAVHDIQPIGPADGFTADGNYRQFRQGIDSTVVLAGLNWGWVIIGVIGVGYLLLVARCFRLRAGPTSIALVAMAPALLTVALITQLPAFVWFLVGLAGADAGSKRTPRVGGTPRQPLAKHATHV